MTVMAASDRRTGVAMLSVAAAVFVYYTVWTIVLPFFDASSPIHDVFLPREWAVRIPAFILILGITAIGLFLGVTIIDDHQKELYAVDCT